MSLFGLFEQIDESPIGCSKGHTHTQNILITLINLVPINALRVIFNGLYYITTVKTKRNQFLNNFENK